MISLFLFHFCCNAPQPQVYPSTVMNIGWTADHRALDGAYVARFANQLKDHIENPEGMILF
mgnify:CR=1 FL=1